MTTETDTYGFAKLTVVPAAMQPWAAKGMHLVTFTPTQFGEYVLVGCEPADQELQHKIQIIDEKGAPRAGIQVVVAFPSGNPIGLPTGTSYWQHGEADLRGVTYRTDGTGFAQHTTGATGGERIWVWDINAAGDLKLACTKVENCAIVDNPQFHNRGVHLTFQRRVVVAQPPGGNGSGSTGESNQDGSGTARSRQGAKVTFRAFVKSEFRDLGIEDILKSAPSVLLGVSRAMEPALAMLGIKTVFDLGLSTLFGNASRVLSNGSDVASDYRKFGRAPASVVSTNVLTASEVASLPWEAVGALVGVDANANLIMQQLSIKTIRDLALWPPYLAAKAIVIAAYNPDLPNGADPEAPRELLPASGEFGTERHLYSSVVMFPGTYGAADPAIPLSNRLFDIVATALTGFNKMRFGARITYSQTWFPKYVAKGQLLHSLPLAPGESTNVAVIDWTNKSKAATTQTISESEKLASTNDRTRAISQVAKSVATDFESGSSQTSAAGASTSGGGTAFLGLGVGSASGSVDTSTSSTHVVSTGSRSIATSLQQNITDSTQQNSSAVRSERAAVVSEVSQSDTRNFSTRTITNYNHMHAMTLQYYEVVQNYEAQVRQEDVERCIFIPMRLFDFQDERIIFKYLPILKRAALSYDTLAQLRRLEDNLDGYKLKWGRVRFTGECMKDRSLKAWQRNVGSAYRNLDNRGFIKGTGTDEDLQLNYQLQLNNVVVVNSRSDPPTSLVTGVNIDLEDGSTITLTTPAQVNEGDPAAINIAFNGKPLSFGKIKSIRLVTQEYIPLEHDKYNQGGAVVVYERHEFLVKVFLAVKLNGESRFLDASFVMDENTSYDNTSLFDLADTPSLSSLEQELMDHQLYYSQQIWLQQNPQNIIMQFAPLQLTVGQDTINLVDYITPIPIKVVGNYLVYPFTYEKDADWQKWLKDNFTPSHVIADMVPIPTGGVFAEAVLGRFNAGERLDLTRFANWSDSPPTIKPPEINPVKFTEPALPTVPSQATFSSPLVNIQNPINLPAPTGLTDVLANIVKGGSFPDVSGLPQSGDAASNAGNLASANSIAAMQASGAALAQLMKSIGKVLQTAVSKDATKTLSDVGALLNKKDETDKPTQKDQADKKDGTAQDHEIKLIDTAVKGSPLATLASDGGTATTLDGGNGTGTGGSADAGTGGSASAGQAGIVASTLTPCVNENVTFRLTNAPAGASINWSGGGNPANGTGNTFTTRFGASGSQTVKADWGTDAGNVSNSATVAVKELSGAQWTGRFQGSNATADLEPTFRQHAEAFIAALGTAGAAVHIAETFRPQKRAYLMRYAYRIANNIIIQPANVPEFDPNTVPAADPNTGTLSICWLHRDANGNPDLAASRAAAQAMVQAYHIEYPPAYPSNHAARTAIDMNITWTGDLTIVDGNGHQVTITSTPRTGAGNADLHAIGATYQVIKLVSDAPHWSANGG